MPLSEAWDRLFTTRVDARWLAVSRIAVGTAAAVKAVIVWGTIEQVLEPARLQIPHFDWFPTLSTTAVPWFTLVWFAAAVALFVGLGTRAAGTVVIGCAAYTLGLDQQLYSNHLYLLAVLTLLMVVGDSGAAWSVDALRRGRDSSDRTVARWPVVLLQLQLSIVYGFAAVSKLNGVYLSGVILSANLRREGWGAVPEAWHTAPVMASLAIGSILSEAFLALGLWAPRLRMAAVAVGIGLHLGIIFFMVPSVRWELIVFGLLMLGLYPLFFSFERQAERELPSI